MQLYTRKDFSDNFVYELIIQLYGPTKAFELTTRKKKEIRKTMELRLWSVFFATKLTLKCHYDQILDIHFFLTFSYIISQS